MPLREVLRDRPDVPDADIDDIIEIAARRQDEARAPDRTASRDEVDAVARELEIAPEHVEAAIQTLREQRAAAATAKAAAEVAAARLKRRLGVGALVAVALGLVGGLGGAAVGASRVTAAAAETQAAEARLDVVFDRQAALAPQIAAAAGADPSGLTALASELRGAPDVAGRLDASARLGMAMATALGQRPPATNEAESTMRLQVQDDLTGTQNRITVELRRYREAESAWQTAAGSGLGGWAVTVGMAEGPPTAAPPPHPSAG